MRENGQKWAADTSQRTALRDEMLHGYDVDYLHSITPSTPALKQVECSFVKSDPKTPGCAHISYGMYSCFGKGYLPKPLAREQEENQITEVLTTGLALVCSAWQAIGRDGHFLAETFPARGPSRSHQQMRR